MSLLFIIGGITTASAVFYFMLFRWLNKGWASLQEFIPVPKENNVGFSIIIPARNEENHIIECLQSILDQDYPKNFYEIIVIDDHSEDKTSEIIEQFILQNQTSNIRLKKLNISESKSYKKAAITKGISVSKFEWIITTDADCVRNPKWLNTFGSFISEQKPKFVSGPVAFSHDESVFTRGQALEFSGLIGIGASSISNKSPNMCNGANLCFEKSAFYEVQGYDGIDSIASGDDEFLMHKMHARWPDKIQFLHSNDAVVYTQPFTGLSGLLNQRKRWVSKSRKYKNKNITYVMMIAWLFHVLIPLNLVLAFFDINYLYLALILISVKIFVEFGFLKKVTTFFNTQELLKSYPISSVAYIPYVIFIGIYGNFGKYHWKGRKVS